MTMAEVTYRNVAATDDDLMRLDACLRALSADLDDAHVAGTDALHAALTGRTPAAHAVLALQGGETRGAALFSPVFSTVRGTPGVYVSDLWVAPDTRGRGLGRGLLSAVADRARTLWGAAWITLAVYEDSTASQRFYERLGFRLQTGARTMVLQGSAMQGLTEETA